MSVPLTVVILAAGKGTRMKSGRPKVLHQVAGRSMIGHVLATAAALEPARTVVVLAPGMLEVEKELSHSPLAPAVAIQDPPMGTGHALMAARDQLAAEGMVLVLYGDTPLVTADTLRQLLAATVEAGAAVGVLGMRPPDTTGYGRLLFDQHGLDAIVEERHADEDLKRDGMCNAGIMVVDRNKLDPLLDALVPKQPKNEYYLTDIVGHARAQGWPCTAIEGPWIEGVGVNAQSQLAEAEALMQGRLREAAMAEGVSMTAPETVFLSADTVLAPGVHIDPYVVFGPGVQVDEGALIHSFSHLFGVRIGADAEIGPFARLRPGAEIGERAKIGNFVEVKNASLEAGAKANHLSYLGDARVGAGSNIGAGTITCNYDGFGKYRTDLGERVFVGSNTSLIAPVKVGDGAIIGAGSTIDHDVPPDALSVGRGRQNDLPEGATRFRARKSRKD
ncbi:MAG: bifunctional UDP-N-acetylglucosamine diphosphorylase/glucosamine-1-phosphate N-acetyltransferase GlmU [Pseudomonadota bacterium]